MLMRLLRIVVAVATVIVVAVFSYVYIKERFFFDRSYPSITMEADTIEVKANEKAEMDKRIRDVLAQVDMINKGYKKPHQLSGGEQQRIAIARALLNSPALILADEPTGNLDPDTTEELMQLLLKINNDGKTIVMATHNHNIITKFRARTLECENSMLIAAREEDIVLNTQDENPYTVEI